MRIAVNGTIASVIAPVHRLAGPATERALRQGLMDGGNKVRTTVRKALRTQTNPISYDTITSRVAGARSGMSYIIRATGKGLPINLFPTQVPGHVEADPWGKHRTFKRSFVRADNGTMMARSGAARFPIHRLYGPSLPKELVKDGSLAAFNTGVTSIVMPAIEKRLARLMGG